MAGWSGPDGPMLASASDDRTVRRWNATTGAPVGDPMTGHTNSVTALAAWIVDRDRGRWDEEIERDFSPGGAGMELLDRVRKQVSDGLSRPFSEGRPWR